MKKQYLKHPLLFTILAALIIHIIILISLESAFTWCNLPRELSPVISKYISSFYPAIVLFFTGIAFLVRAKKQHRPYLRRVNNALGILLLLISFMALQGAVLLL